MLETIVVSGTSWHVPNIVWIHNICYVRWIQTICDDLKIEFSRARKSIGVINFKIVSFLFGCYYIFLYLYLNFKTKTMESTNRLMYTWELIEAANKLDDTNNMKPLILKSLGVSQSYNKAQGLFGPRVSTRMPITALIHRCNAQVMLENIDDEKTQLQFRQIYENFVM